MRFLSYFSPNAPKLLVYMIQQVEYDSAKFIRWIASAPDLSLVMRRQRLELTVRSKLLTAATYGFYVLGLLGSLSVLRLGNVVAGLVIVILTPLVSVLLLAVTNLLLDRAIIQPSEAKEIKSAKTKLETIDAVRIAVLGSYGKTTMKELLLTILSEGKNVAATPGNKNVLISHARWVNQKLTGSEKVLIFEYGEGKPGDISKLAGFSKPEMAVITGLAPAHLDRYATVEAIANDFATIQKFVEPGKLYINGSSELLGQKIKGMEYSQAGVGNIRASDVSVDFAGTSFTLHIDNKTLKLKTKLLGNHQVGPVCAAVAVAMKLGLRAEQIVHGVALVEPHEHRMQPRYIGGAWIIDDAYNGNIEGMRAGLELLKILQAKRKVYVTPGLVDQGPETAQVHYELGKLIAQAQPNRLVLMQNSVTSLIQKGLESNGFNGELTVESNPLEFYSNIEHFVASGDVVLLQNDWTDNYK